MPKKLKNNAHLEFVPTQPSFTLTASSNPLEQDNLVLQNDDTVTPKPQTPLEIAIQNEENTRLNLQRLEREAKLIKYCIAKKNKKPLDKQLLSIENSLTEGEKKFVDDHLKFSLKTLEKKEQDIIQEKGKTQRDLNSAIEKIKQERINQDSRIMNNAIEKINDPNYDVENNRTLTKIQENKWSWTNDDNTTYHAVKHSGKFYYLNPENEFEIINTKKINKLIGYYDPQNNRIITQKDANNKFYWIEPKTNQTYGIVMIYDGITKPPYGIHKLTPGLHYTRLKENITYIGKINTEGTFFSNYGIDINNNRIFWVDNEKNQSFWTHPKTKKVYRLIMLCKEKNTLDFTFGYIINDNLFDKLVDKLVEVDQDGNEKIIASNVSINKYGQDSNIKYCIDVNNNNRMIQQSSCNTLSYTEPNTNITYEVIKYQNKFLYLNEDDCIVDFKENGEIIFIGEFDRRNNRILHLDKNKVLHFTDPNTQKTYTVKHFITSNTIDGKINLGDKYAYYNEDNKEVEIDKNGNEKTIARDPNTLIFNFSLNNEELIKKITQ